MFLMSLRVRSMLACLFLLIATGCSPSHPATSPVSGTITYKGAPVGEAVVVFAPDGSGRPATATTDAQGNFRLSTFGEFDGAMPGNYKVTVTKLVKNKVPAKTEEQLHEEFERQLQTGQAPPAPAVEYLVPEKYSSADKTTLQFTVKAAQNDEARFELTD